MSMSDQLLYLQERYHVHLFTTWFNCVHLSSVPGKRVRLLRKLLADRFKSKLGSGAVFGAIA